MRTLLLPAFLMLPLFAAPTADWSFEIQQITQGPNHHFFGYIGHVRNIAFNEGNRYILSLRVGFQNRMPEPADAADIVLIDTRQGYRTTVIDKTRAWNFQQGTFRVRFGRTGRDSRCIASTSEGIRSGLRALGSSVLSMASR